MIKQFFKKKTQVRVEKDIFDSGDLRDFSEYEKSFYRGIKPYTMTSPQRVKALIDSISYLVKNGIEGDIVECGVWKGGSSMAMIKKLIEFKEKRKIWLYDTFEGMSEPTELDLDIDNRDAKNRLLNEDKYNSNIWAYSPLQEVKKNISTLDYDDDSINYVVGKVEETLITEKIPEKISLLRLDTDWYESTKIELEVLFPLVSKGGIIIIDDYGHWQGCKTAVDEYFKNNQLHLLFNRIDYTGRLIIKN